MNRAEITEFHAGGDSSRVMSTRPASALSSFSSNVNSAEKENQPFNHTSSITQEETKLTAQEISKIQNESMKALQNPQFNSLIHTNFEQYQTPSDGTFLSSPFSIRSQSSRKKTIIGSSTQTPLIKFKHSYADTSEPSQNISNLFSPEFMKSQLDHTSSQILYKSKSPSQDSNMIHFESSAYNKNTARFQETQSTSSHKSHCPLIKITDCEREMRAQTSPGQEEELVRSSLLRTYHHSKASSLEELLKILPEMNLETQTSENSVLADMVKNISGQGSYNCTLTKFLIEASEKKKREEKTVKLKDINKLLDSMISETKPLKETEKLAYKIYRRGGQEALQFLKKVSLLTGRGFKIVRKKSRDFDVSLVSELPCASDEDERVAFFKKEQVLENAKQMSWCFEQVLGSMVGGLRGVKSELEGVSQKLNQANESLSLD